MKTTGLIVMLIGFAIAAFVGIGSVATQPSGAEAVDRAAAGPSMLFPAIMAAVAVVAGAALMIYGNRGYVRTQDPTVRN